MCLMPAVTEKTGYINSKKVDIKLSLYEKTSNILEESYCSPWCSDVDHSSLSAQLWTSLKCFRLPSPTLCLNAGGKQQPGSVMKTRCLMQRNQRVCLKTHQHQSWRQKTKVREGTGSKGLTEGFLCSASVSRVWQATWKQFSFFPQTYRIKSMLVIDIKGSQKKGKTREKNTSFTWCVYVCVGGRGWGALWYLRIKSDCKFGFGSSEDPESMSNWEKSFSQMLWVLIPNTRTHTFTNQGRLHRWRGGGDMATLKQLLASPLPFLLA